MCLNHFVIKSRGSILFAVCILQIKLNQYALRYNPNFTYLTTNPKFKSIMSYSYDCQRFSLTHT